MAGRGRLYTLFNSLPSLSSRASQYISDSVLEMILSPREQFLLSQLEGSATGIQWVEARDSAKCPKMHRAAQPQGFIWPKMSTACGLRNPVLGGVCFPIPQTLSLPYNLLWPMGYEQT